MNSELVMIAKTTPSLLLLFAVLFLSSISALAQTQTTGRTAGTVKDLNGAIIVGAEVTVINKATGDERKVNTDKEGNYTVQLLPPGTDLPISTASGCAAQLIEVYLPQ